jgi:hypothetical protein
MPPPHAQLRPPLPDSRLAYALCQASGWGAFTVLRIWTALAGTSLPAARVALSILLLNGGALALTETLHRYVRRHHWQALRPGPLVVRILAASCVLAVPLTLASVLTPVFTLQLPDDWVQGARASGHGRLLLLGLLVNGCNWALLFALWLAMYFTLIAIREHRGAALRQSELSRALQLAELKLLKSQLNPHFLFNALNTVRSLITEDAAKAQLAVTRLASTLRYTLRANHQELAPLAHELEIVLDYLELEKLRFEERLAVRIEVTREAARALIPVMLLQTVVENAVKHGIAELPAGGELCVSALLERDVVLLEVRNPRSPASAQPDGASGGTGLRNSQERLRLMFGSDAGLELDLSIAEVAVTRIRIPQRS